MSSAFICDGIRTPIGRYGGALSSVRPDDLGAIVLRALRDRNPSVDWEALDDVILGCANQAGEDNRNVARMSALLAELPISAGGVTVNRLCGSGLEAIAQAARMIAAGDADLVVAGGVESMSRAPLVVSKPTGGFARNQTMEDTTIGWRFINPEMERLYGADPLGETAENVAQEYGISREDQDRFALRSQSRAAAAMENGRFAREITPVEINTRRETVIVDIDEHPRPDTKLEKLAQLKPAFRNGGSVTAGNSSGVNDGAATLIIASESAVKQHGLNPIARIMGATSAGVAPRLMGIGPVPATQKLLKRLGMSVDQFGAIELNEAFAAQALASARALGLDDKADHVNPNGGAIALGHPLGMSGARLALTASLELTERNAQFGLCAMCIGVGQGVAMAIERV